MCIRDRVRGVVRGLLQRNPLHRPSMEQCLTACRRILEVSTMTVNKSSAQLDESPASGDASDGMLDDNVNDTEEHMAASTDYGKHTVS